MFVLFIEHLDKLESLAQVKDVYVDEQLVDLDLYDTAYVELEIDVWVRLTLRDVAVKRSTVYHIRWRVALMMK